MSLKNIILQINNASETVQTVKIAGGEGGVGARGQGVRIKALGNVKYHFTDEATGYGPENIATKRVGKNLHIAFEGGDVDQPDLVIEDYYKDNGEIGYGEGTDNLLVGTHENGNVYPYIPESSVGTDAVSMLADGVQAGQALGTSVAPVPLWWLPLLILPALGGGDGGGAPVPPDHQPEIKDLTPLVDGGDATVYEKALDGKGSEHGLDTEKGTGDFTISSPDGVKSVKINGIEVIKNGVLVSNPEVVTPEGNKLVVTSYDPNTGKVIYEYTLLDNEMHTKPATDTALFDSMPVEVLDDDGDSATGTLTVKIVDDVPSAIAEASQDVAEGATLTGQFDFVAGADGATLTHIGTTELEFDTTTGWSQWVDLGAGEIRAKADGSYEFKAAAVTQSPVDPIEGTFTVTDGDGDTATAGFAFQVTDANEPTDNNQSAANVDDDGLTGGNPTSGTTEVGSKLATFTGTLVGSVGADGAGANGFSFAGLAGQTGVVGQETVTYAWDATTNTLTATGPRGALFTVQITDKVTGAYTVTLLDNVLHATLDGADGDDTENPATLALKYSIKDADGSETTNNTLTITFDDDAPSVSIEDKASVAEGATLNGTWASAIGADVEGAITKVVVAGQEYDLGSEITVGALGKLTVKADHTWTFVANNGLDNEPVPTVNFTVRVTDGDGDVVEATESFTITDGNTPTDNNESTAKVDDDGLTGGNPTSGTTEVGSKLATFTGTLVGSVGADGAGANGFSFAGLAGQTGVVGQETVTYAWDATTNTLTATGPRGALFTVQITDKVTGAYTVTLLQNVLHATLDGATGDNTENPATLALAYSIKDADGSATTNNTLTITFDDDTPVTKGISHEMAVGVDTVAVNNLKAGFVGYVLQGGGTVPSDNRFNEDTDSYVDRIQWGSSFGGYSSYKLVDNPAFVGTGGAAPLGEIFKLGDFTHANNPITGTPLDYVTVELKFDVVVNGVTQTLTAQFKLDHTETPNNGPHPDDIITIAAVAGSGALVQPDGSLKFVLSNSTYSLTIKGFRDALGNYVQEVDSKESSTNTFQIYAIVETEHNVAPVSSNIFSNGGLLPGADNMPLGAVEWEAHTSVWGTFTGNADGSYDFEVSDYAQLNLEVGQTRTETFSYSYTDADGDTVTGVVSIDIGGYKNVFGASGTDTITGAGSNDHLEATATHTKLVGGDGDDYLVGNLSVNVLTGGSGADRFVFNTALNGNVDTITDFGNGADKLVLSSLVFEGLSAGGTVLLETGVAATTDKPTVLYDASTGMLSYDKDGSGAGAAAVNFAELQNKPVTLSSTDFVII